MAYCYFDKNFNKRFNCTYEIKEDYIALEVEYDITDEIEAKNGVKVVSSNHLYKKRDILVVDANNAFLLKNAFYSGYEKVHKRLFQHCITRFKSYWYFEGDVGGLENFEEKVKISGFSIMGPFINDLAQSPRLLDDDDGEIIHIKYKDKSNLKTIKINANNIKSITLDSYLNNSFSYTKYIATLKQVGRILIEFTQRINYDNILDFFNELMLYLQLYIPNGITIERINALIDGKEYGFHFPYVIASPSKQRACPTVGINVFDFLSNCYQKIPYHKGESYVRNIRSIVFPSNRIIEESYSVYYRYIEHYYKSVKKDNNYFIVNALKEHCHTMKNKDISKIEQIAAEMIALRNQYIHEGYDIGEEGINISYKKMKALKKNENYFETNIDDKWILSRTKLLYSTCIDIVFEELLGYKDYHYFNDMCDGNIIF